MIARDLMQKNLVVARPDMSLLDLAAFLNDHGITGAPVVERGQLIGVVSLADIASHLPLKVAPGFYRHPWNQGELTGFSIEEPGTEVVRDVMSPAVYRVEDTAPIQEIADLMVKSDIHRVVVVRNGKAVGIISTLDLVRAIPVLLPQPALP